MRCGKCGNDNSEANRFCGMCGAALVAKSEPGESPMRATASPSVKKAEAGAGSVAANPQSVPRAATEAQPAPPSPASTSPTVASKIVSPSITGPSFLGLNTPADKPSVDATSGHDPLQRSSRNLDYLLEDDEELPRRWGKVAAIVIALVLVGGFGYLRFRQGGFDWLTKSDAKPAAAQQSADAPPSSADSGSTTSGTAAPPGSSPTAAASAPATTPVVTPPAATETTAPQTAASQPSAPQSGPTQTAPTPAGPTPTGPAQASPSQAGPTDSEAHGDSTSQPAARDSDAQSQPAEATPAPKPRERKPTPAKPVDPVSEAERYIYGRGVSQDCDRGMRILKPAAEQANAQAMISLGAIYYTGTCTPRDLPTAYRWFALALHKQPDNQALQDGLQKLWSQMTPPERQLAIKLSQ